MHEAALADAELRQSGLGDLAVLHDHLISYITFLLDLEDVVRLSCCSRLLRVFACEEPLWLGLCLKLQEGVVEYKANWRQTALANYTAKAVPAVALGAAARPLPPLQGLSSMFLYKRWYRCHVDLSHFLPPPEAATVGRVNAAAMSPAEFVERYDKPGLPVLMEGLLDSWPVSSWSLPALSATFPTSLFKVSKPHGGRCLMTMQAYADYMARQADEEPLYVFDPSFAESAPGIRQLYDVPHVFAQDLYSGLQDARPNYRWLVLGPARAGASWHVDPALTSAWNALLSGRKRWALYPPHVPPPGVELDDDGEEAHTSDDGLTSLQWFLEVYPNLPPERRPIEFVQNPGDVVFVPGGWWHCVLNLETAVAVTQNYVGEANLGRVTRYMADGSSAYHDHPLEYFDPEAEVAAWSAKYPVFGPSGAGAGAGARCGAEAMEVDSSEEASEGDEELQQQRRQSRRKERQQIGRQRRRQLSLGQRQRSRQQRKGEEEREEGLEVGGDSSGAAALKKARRGASRSAAVEMQPLPTQSALRRAARGLYSRFLVNGSLDGGHGLQQDAPLHHQNGCGATANGHAIDVGPPATTAAVAAAAAAADTARFNSSSSPGAGSVGGGEVADMTWLGELQYEEVAVWRRERILGRWLRRLWNEEPSTRTIIQDCLSRHLHAAFWRDVLGAITRQQPGVFRNGPGGGESEPLAEPTPFELLPLVGADALVFLYGGTAIKIFVHEITAMRGLMCALEARALQLLLPPRFIESEAAVAAAAADGHAAAGAVPSATAPLPQPLAWGTVAATLTSRGGGAEEHSGSEPESEAGDDDVENTEEEQQVGMSGGSARAAINGVPQQAGESAGPDGVAGGPVDLEDPEQRLLYLVQQQLHGTHVLQELLDQELGPRHVAAVAEALGDLLGAMHAASAAGAAAAAEQPFGGQAPAGIAALIAASRGGEGAAAAAAPLSVEEWDVVVRRHAVWHERYHSIWVSGLGCLSSPLAGMDDDDGVDGAASAGGANATDSATAATSLTDAAAAGSADGSGGGLTAAGGRLCEVPVASRWWPFVQHLRQRKRQLLRSLPASSLPTWVQEQLPAYLPEDPAQLLGLPLWGASPTSGDGAGVGSGDGDGPSAGPLLLHGDVTAHNVIVAQPPPPLLPPWPSPSPQSSSGAAGLEAAHASKVGHLVMADVDGGGVGGGDDDWRPQLSLVDFSDAGHGDPLYELLPVLGSCLRCDTKAAARFWERYCRHVDVNSIWPRRRRWLAPGSGGSDGAAVAADTAAVNADVLKRSYCAMCYCLLHEEAELLLQRVWQAAGPEGMAMTAAKAGRSGGGEGVGGVPDGGLAAAANCKAAPHTLEELAVRLWGFLDE